MKLTHKQQRFVEEYLVDFNAGRAALAAGYSPRTARYSGPENLKKPAVQAAIEAGMADKKRQSIMAFDEATQILTDIARARVGDYFDDQGRFDFAKLKTVHPHAVAAVKQRLDGDGNPIIEFRLHPPVQALERLAKLLGWDKPDRHEHELTCKILTPDDLDDDADND